MTQSEISGTDIRGFDAAVRLEGRRIICSVVPILGARYLFYIIRDGVKYKTRPYSDQNSFEFELDDLDGSIEVHIYVNNATVTLPPSYRVFVLKSAGPDGPFHASADSHLPTGVASALVASENLVIADTCQALRRDDGVLLAMKSSLDWIASDFGPAENVTADTRNVLWVSLPFTGERFAIASDGWVDWVPSFGSHAATNTVFFYSLQWIGHWICRYETGRQGAFLQRAEEQIRGFLRFVSIPANSTLVMGIRSSDHSVSIRIRVLIKFLAAYWGGGGRDVDFVRSILLHVLFLTAWSLDVKNFRESNHGLMASISLLHVAIQFRNFAVLHEKLLEVSAGRVLALARSAFDRDGLCNENTIGYHRFNTSLYEGAIQFAEHYCVRVAALDELRAIVARARDVLGLIVWQDGSIPPIGDSPVYPAVCRSINQSSIFAQSGFLVIKNEDLYLSLVCGSRGWVHKQCDDSSVTIRFKGRNVVIDAGHYTHDQDDPFRIALAGQRGHSGIYLEQFDGMLREQFVRQAAPYRASIESFTQSATEASVICGYSIGDSRWIVRRMVRVIWPDEVLIADRFEARDGESQPVRQRFIFDHGASVECLEQNRYTIGHGEQSATLMHFGFGSAELYAAQKDPVCRGWCSVKFGELQPATGLDFAAAGNRVVFVTAVLLGDGAGNRTPSAALRAAIAQACDGA